MGNISDIQSIRGHFGSEGLPRSQEYKFTQPLSTDKDQIWVVGPFTADIPHAQDPISLQVAISCPRLSHPLAADKGQKKGRLIA